jgi:Flp pilus assembly protein TadG
VTIWAVSRRLRTASQGDEGSALVEFVFLAVLMLVPIVYLIVALGRIQAGALAVEQGTREAGRAFVTAPDETIGTARAQAAGRLAYADQGFPAPAPRQLRVECTATPCLSANARVTVHGELTVVLPGVPRFLARVIPIRVTVSAVHVATVDQFSVR